ncbi:protein CrcB [Methylorubrum extorquens]|uniref:Fluoride-specific ion channel FluC n=1 Tax=Methylorubrum extorquens TaxID=408 RepID=A0A1S1P8V3_METEX|nr:protein CrcB [Methylorubrum extorquens]
MKGQTVGFVIVFLGAGIGGAFRHGINLAALRLLGAGAFPYGTLSINVLGSFLMGLIAEYFALKAGLPMQLRLFLTTGILGGFTTFSAFSLETALLYEKGQGWAALVYAAASVVLAVGALILALGLVRAFVNGGAA